MLWRISGSGASQERMAYLGVAPEPLPMEVLRGAAASATTAAAVSADGSTAQRLAAAIRVALSNGVKRAAEELAQVRN